MYADNPGDNEMIVEMAYCNVTPIRPRPISLDCTSSLQTINTKEKRTFYRPPKLWEALLGVHRSTRDCPRSALAINPVQ